MANKIIIANEKISIEQYKHYFSFYNNNVTIVINCQKCKKNSATTILRCNNHRLDINGEKLYHCNVSEFLCDTCHKEFKKLFYAEDSDGIFCCGQGVRTIVFDSLQIYNER